MNRRHTVTFTFAEIEASLRVTHRGEFSTASTVGKPVIEIVDGEQIRVSYDTHPTGGLT